MSSIWDQFLSELDTLSTDSRILQYINGPVIEKALNKVRQGAFTDHAGDPDYKIVMRALIVYRFINRFERG